MQTILPTAAGPRRLGRVMALVAVPGQLAPLLGPVLGGLVLVPAALLPNRDPELTGISTVAGRRTSVR
ncbi:hypothetical protein [Streptosporangium sp. LJ11]|uniref:hypothetical protein n=1 Tax=Streptosporangium sp. LJ11 TaxID=3436927 RepID=UPI003F79D206